MTLVVNWKRGTKQSKLQEKLHTLKQDIRNSQELLYFAYQHSKQKIA